MIRARLLAPAMLALLAGCEHAKEATLSAAASTTASASPPPSAAESASGAEEAIDPDEEYLRRAAVLTLAPRRAPGGRAGMFEAVFAAPGGSRSGTAEPASTATPTALKAPLAFYRLSRALGMRVVPVTVVRPIPLADLGAAIGEGPDAHAILDGLRTLNDGTVDVLLAARSSPSAGSAWDAPRGPAFDPDGAREVATWDRWASEPAPAPGEDSALLRDYVEMLVLDYLAANVARRAVTRSGSALVLADNASAFPPHADRSVLDRLLRRLRSIARFPRGLRDALARFDRRRAAATFTSGAFEAWLLAPRTVVELDERRAALLTLVEARIAERGAASVLAL